MFFSSLGCGLLALFGYFEPRKLTKEQDMAVFGFSFLFTLNMAVSNVSLSWVTVPVISVLSMDLFGIDLKSDLKSSH